MARTGLRMMPTFPSSPLRFRTVGFPQYGSKAGLSDGAFPCGLRPSFAVSATGHSPRSESRWHNAEYRRRASGITALPQGPSLRSGLCCPGPSSLTRPHPPHSQAHHDFTAWRLIRDALAVPFGLGDPRAVPCFHCSFLPDMPSSTTPGSSPATYAPTCATDDTGLRLFRTSSALPTYSHHPFQVGPSISGLHWFTYLLRPVVLLASLTDPTGSPQPQRRVHPGFRRVGHPSRRRIWLQWHLGILHWRDFHPLERQLASLHPKGEGVHPSQTETLR